ncbi:hypothetical protein DEJ48_38875 [Streptomyces venezuelae]|uniref:Uncharacterized protein n=1 Tax=Streptomyces venezuelae TaxID=54571 RepID=A0A5P2C7P0_STRVZ|nr:hypothetical protein DEJ48_38875 [Streptomyces venezuelae]
MLDGGFSDWKVLLGLELTDPGFDQSVLSEFRDRLMADRAPTTVPFPVTVGLSSPRDCSAASARWLPNWPTGGAV